MPPSTAAALAVSDTVVVSIVSATLVTTGAPSMTRFSNPPPLASLIDAATLPASTTTSSVGAVTLIAPLLLPAGIVIALPLDSVTVTVLSAGAVRVAV